jgi:hypothetical protein
MEDLTALALANRPAPGPQRTLLQKLAETWPAKMAQSIWGGMTLPGDVWQGNVSVTGPDGRTNPEVINRATDLAGIVMGGTYAATPARAANEAVLGSGPIKAYHGSPHDFDRFDISKIGTGEGAQAYGHGLYFAQNPATAEAYKNSVTRNMEQLVELGRGQGLTPDAAQLLAESYSRGFGGKRFESWMDDVKAAAENPLLDARSRGAAQQILDKSVEASDAFAKMKAPGKMYEVAIHADPQRFLDWDKPLNAQGKVGEAVREAVPKPGWLAEQWGGMPVIRHGLATGPDATGRDAYSFLGRMLDERRGDPKATQVLRDAGIPGIKYLDQGSRVAGDGSRNYVTFSDDIVEILRKYGIAGLIGAGGAGMYTNDRQQQ